MPRFSRQHRHLLWRCRQILRAKFLLRDRNLACFTRGESGDYLDGTQKGFSGASGAVKVCRLVSRPRQAAVDARGAIDEARRTRRKYRDEERIILPDFREADILSKRSFDLAAYDGLLRILAQLRALRHEAWYDDVREIFCFETRSQRLKPTLLQARDISHSTLYSHAYQRHFTIVISIGAPPRCAISLPIKRHFSCHHHDAHHYSPVEFKIDFIENHHVRCSHQICQNSAVAKK